MKVEIDLPAEAMVEELMWHASLDDVSPKLRKALERVAAYYMTWDQAERAFGTKKAERYFYCG